MAGFTKVRAQSSDAIPIPIGPGIDTSVGRATKKVDEKDLIDVITHIIHKHASKREDTATVKTTKLRFSAVPAAGYTLQTGFAALAVANIAFYTNTDSSTSISTILTNITYTEKKQIILPLLASIWTKDNNYNLSFDWRYVKFPSITYGLGGYTQLSDGYTIDYSGIRLHQTINRKITNSM